MSALTPQPLEKLLSRALAELDARRSVFDFPRRSFWQTPEGINLSVESSGGIADTPLGPAAGPHTQLAHNIVIAWLAGARFMELKTVQVLDSLDIAKPCIDAMDVGYNVEWSQELSIEQSTEQYASAWLLIHALQARGLVGDASAPVNTCFEASVGYDLAGIRSDTVARFLDTLVDCTATVQRLRDRVPGALRGVLDVNVPSQIISGVTLSTFHGCPAEEIEHIVEHLLTRHHLHVVVKLNPTLLGYDEVDAMLHAQMGYDEIALDPTAFQKDLSWEHAIQMFDRLAPLARREGLTLGAKFTNTLVVHNTRGYLDGRTVYLSGAPLHPIAIRLADRFTQATRGLAAPSFSAGVDAENVAETVACGFQPVTVCTDLLRPTGYRRLPRHLKSLVAAMKKCRAGSIEEFVRLRGGADDAQAGAHATLSRYADTVVADVRYHAGQHREERQRSGPLQLLDCESCNNCLLTCPNDAFVALAIAPVSINTWDLVFEGGKVRERATRLETTREKQWVVFADLCNACGNCDAFCPEEGGPYRRKPRVFGSLAAFEAAAPGDGFVFSGNGDQVRARFEGVVHVLERSDLAERFSDGRIEVFIDPGGEPSSVRAHGPEEGHVLSLTRYHTMRLLRDALFAGVNWVSAGRGTDGFASLEVDG